MSWCQYKPTLLAINTIKDTSIANATRFYYCQQLAKLHLFQFGVIIVLLIGLQRVEQKESMTASQRVMALLTKVYRKLPRMRKGSNTFPSVSLPTPNSSVLKDESKYITKRIGLKQAQDFLHRKNEQKKLSEMLDPITCSLRSNFINYEIMTKAGKPDFVVSDIYRFQ